MLFSNLGQPGWHDLCVYRMDVAALCLGVGNILMGIDIHKNVQEVG